MSLDPSRSNQTFGAVTGRQQVVRGSNANVSGTPTTQDLIPFQNMAGQTLATGTFYYFLPCNGSQAIDVTLLMSAHSGTAPTITLYKLLTDCVTEKLDAAGSTTQRVTITVTDSTQVTGSITILRGEQGCMLKIVVPSSATATFTIAEHSSL